MFQHVFTSWQTVWVCFDLIFLVGEITVYVMILLNDVWSFYSVHTHTHPQNPWITLMITKWIVKEKTFFSTIISSLIT
jgi:hypothetical protein